MRKYLILSLVTTSLVVAILFIPQLVISSFPLIEATYPVKRLMVEDVYISGVVQEEHKKDVSFDIPIVPSEVFFKVGDYVNANDVIANVDVNATKEALLSLLDVSSIIPKEYMGIISSFDFNLSNISVGNIDSYIQKNIKSPISGVISDISLVKGAISLPKATAVVVSNVQDISIKMSVDEKDADKISVGQKVIFKANATGDKNYSGTITKIFPVATKKLAGTSTSTVVGFYVKPDYNYDRLIPGYTVSGVIRNSYDNSAVTLPYEAIMQDDGNNEYVYVYQDNKKVKRVIETGRESFYFVEVTSGISEEDMVVLP